MTGFCAHCGDEFDRQFVPFGICYCKDPVCSERCAKLHEDYHERARDDADPKRKRPGGWPSLLSNIECDLDKLELLGNMVLVKRLPDDEERNGVVLPEKALNKSGEGQHISARDNVPTRKGVVVKLGRGGRIFRFSCRRHEEFLVDALATEGDRPKCHECGLPMSFDKYTGRRDTFPVARGDVIFYPRVPANDIQINGEHYTILREHQHILAVLEAA